MNNKGGYDSGPTPHGPLPKQVDIPEEEVQTNLKEDFIWFTPRINAPSIMQCTCGKFKREGMNYDWLARKAIQHARKSGHQLNPRGK